PSALGRHRSFRDPAVPYRTLLGASRPARIVAGELARGVPVDERISAVEATRLASGLGFPEGPVVLPDGGIVFCDGNVGELVRYEDSAVDTYAVTGGSPWGAVLGADGAIYVTQGGNVPGSGDTSAVPGIQRVRRGGSAELLCSEVAGYTLGGPNDLAFGPDGRLYFTDSEAERLFAIDASGGGEMLFERPGCYPNGLA